MLGALALSACGFTPVMGPGGSATALYGQVDIDPPRDPIGFAFVRHMETRLGRAEAPLWRLWAEIRMNREEIGVRADEEITRYAVTGSIRYRLTEIATGRVAASGEVDDFTTFAATGTPFATDTAARAAEERLMVILGDQIVARLMATAEEITG